MPIVQVIIDQTASMTHTGVHIYDRELGGTFVGGAGAAFPLTPVAGEWFWRTDESRLYRRNSGNSAWDSVVSAIAAHSTTHKNGGSDEVATATPAAAAIPKADGSGKLDSWVTADAAAATSSLRKLGTGATEACAGNDGRLSDARTPTSHAASHNAGGGDALAIDSAAGTGSLRTLGTAATSACAGNDSRLSDARTPTAHASTHAPGSADAIPTGTTNVTVCIGNDARLSDDRTASGLRTATTVVATAAAAAPTTGQVLTATGGSAATWQTPTATDANAIHKNVAAEISTITEKTVPVAADLLIIEDSAASNAKKSLQAGNLIDALGLKFGRNYASAVSEGNSTTTSATFQDKVTLTTGALTGVYRINFYCEIHIGSANARHQCRLYNSTDAVELCYDEHRPSLAQLFKSVSGFVDVTFAGVAKTIILQFASQGGSATVTIRRARIEIWRET